MPAGFNQRPGRVREMSVNAARHQGHVRAKNDLSARLRHSSFQHSCNKRISKARRVAGE